jgi:hypothetical protein
MSDSTIDTRTIIRGELRRGLAASGRVIGAAVRAGRLRLDGLARSERVLAMVGVVTFVGLMESLLAAGLWRNGPLVDVNPGGGEPQLLPLAALPVTLLALGLGWLLLCWGAVRAAFVPRLITAVVFLLANARLGNPEFLLTQNFNVESLTGLASLLRIAYFAVPVLLLLPSILPSESRARAPAIRALRAMLTLVVGGLFVGMFWFYVGERGATTFSTLPERLNSLLEETQLLARPIELLGGVGIVVFAWVIARATVAGAEQAPRAPLRGILAVAIGLKLVLAAATLPVRSEVVPVALVGGALLIVCLLRARQPGDGRGRFEERLLYAGVLFLAVPWLGYLLVYMLGTLTQVQLELRELNWLQQVDPAWVNRYGEFSMGAAVLVIAAAWMVFRGPAGRRGFALPAMLMTGVWVLLVSSRDAFGADVVFDGPAIDAVTTVAVAGIVAARWKQLGRGESAYLLAFVVFTTLMLHQVDVFDPVAAVLGLAPTVTLVLGLGWILVGDSGFTAGHGPRFPRGAPALMWVGYLVIAVAILNWQVLSLSFDPASGFLGETGYVLLGVPLAAALLLAEPLRGALRGRQVRPARRGVSRIP